MKIKTTDKSESNEILEFPCLMEFSKNVVLFHEKNKGTILRTFNMFHYVGEYSEEWQMERFVPFKGQIILEND